MFSKNSGIVDPFNYTIALAENAAQNGAKYFFDHEVTGIDRKKDETGNFFYMVTTKHGIFKSLLGDQQCRSWLRKISDICKIIAMAKICVKRQRDEYTI